MWGSAAGRVEKEPKKKKQQPTKIKKIDFFFLTPFPYPWIEGKGVGGKRSNSGEKGEDFFFLIHLRSKREKTTTTNNIECFFFLVINNHRKKIKQLFASFPLISHNYILFRVFFILKKKKGRQLIVVFVVYIMSSVLTVTSEFADVKKKKTKRKKKKGRQNPLLPKNTAWECV